VDRSASFGIGLALAGIGVGLYLDGGKVTQLLQPTAALIVFGGTLGAVAVQFPTSVIKRAVAQLKDVFFGRQDPAQQLIDDLARYAAQARRAGLLSLDSELELIQNPFLKKGLTLAIDGSRSEELRDTMELVMNNQADEDDLLSKVFEAAGGFAPTIGILGAVIGLIQVMQRLENINEVGKGIAVAFVATIYGVGAANLVFLPCAGRIAILMRRRQVLRELVLEGVLAIVDRTNPRVLEERLMIYLREAERQRESPIKLAA
jgi:chemotaxis protein MotA